MIEKCKAEIEEKQKLGKPILFELLDEIERAKRQFIREAGDSLPSAIILDRNTYDDICYLAFRRLPQESLGENPYRPTSIMGMGILIDYVYRGKLIQMVSVPLPPSAMLNDVDKVVDNLIKRLHGRDPSLSIADTYFPIKYIHDARIAKVYMEAVTLYTRVMSNVSLQKAQAMVFENIKSYMEKLTRAERDTLASLLFVPL